MEIKIDQVKEQKKGRNAFLGVVKWTIQDVNHAIWLSKISE